MADAIKKRYIDNYTFRERHEVIRINIWLMKKKGKAMGNTADIIQALILRIEQYHNKTKKNKIVQQLIMQLRNRFHEFLMEDDDEDFFKYAAKLFCSSSVNPYITNNFYPTNIDEYADYGNLLGFSNDFRFEIRWLITCIASAQEKINDFVAQREMYDNHVLLNEYEEALAIIEDIESKYGVSYWTIEGRFFLNSKLGIDSAELVRDTPANVYGSALSFYELKNREDVTSDEYYYITRKEVSMARKYVKGCDEGIEFIDYCISGNEYHSEPDRIMLALKVIQYCSIIDRYLFFIKICNELMNQPKGNYLYVSVQSYIDLLQDINDDHLVTLRFVFDEEDSRKQNYTLKSRLDNVKSNFISGKLSQVRTEAVELLKQFPNNIEAMRLLVETNILINDGEKQFENTNLGLLLDRLESIYELRESRDDAMEAVSKLALTCSQSTWAPIILSDVLYRCCKKDEFEYAHHKIISNLQHLDIETMIVSMDEDEAVSFISEKMDIENNYIQFRMAMLKGEYKQALALCNIEPIKDYLFIKDDYSTEEKLKHLHAIEGENTSIAIFTMKEFLAAIDIEENPEIVFNLAANLVVDNIYTSLIIPWGKIIDYIDNGPSEIRQNICTPILYYVYAYYIEKTKKDDLGIVCNDFFFMENIERPSEMHIFEGKYDKKMLVYFLKNVCTTKIMDDALCIFENTQERDQERVEICNLLTHLDPDCSKEYENEIREITQKLMINKELKIIDESRIHVNVDGIRDRLVNAEGTGNRFDKSLKNDFQRYLFYRDEKVQQWMQFLQGDEASFDKYAQMRSTSERLCMDLVLKIRDAFVSSDEYGLNGYLSLNIRHNTLDDELRSPLNKSMLYVKRDSDKNEYIIHEYWKKLLSGEDIRILQKALGDFYTTTERILAKLKRDYIQICTETKPSKGLFDYTIYEGDINNLSFMNKKVKTFEEFFDGVINYLWAITEENLRVIQLVIQNEIKQDYLNALSQLRNDIAEIRNQKVLQKLQRKINETEIDMQHVLERICHWFQRSNESKHSDFDLMFAFKLGLQTVENMHPEKHFVVDELEPTESGKIPGCYLKSFDGIFYNLFDNIYKKATPRQSDGAIRIGYALKNMNGKIRIYIENDYDCTGDMSEALKRVGEARRLYETGEYVKKADDEGGTGIPKICKIIRYELNHIPAINFGFVNDKNIFYMEIII